MQNFREKHSPSTRRASRYIKTQARGKEGEKEKKENTNFPTKSETVVLIKPHPRVYIYTRQSETLPSSKLIVENSSQPVRG